jgi:hypothetical protein
MKIFLCTDACKEGLDRVLTQKYHAVCYESKNLKEHEMNYATRDLELALIVHALKMLRHHLIRRKFELRVDHCGLKHLFRQPMLNARQTRWLEFLSEYEFEIKHIKGIENQLVDEFSRRENEMHVTTISMYRSDLKENY